MDKAKQIRQMDHAGQGTTAGRIDADNALARGIERPQACNAAEEHLREFLFHYPWFEWEFLHKRRNCLLNCVELFRDWLYWAVHTVRRRLQRIRNGPESITTEEAEPLGVDMVRRLREGAYGGYYGGCPTCGCSEGPLNLLRENWLFCRAHRVRWCVGVGLFDTLAYEWDAWQLIDRYLLRFREVTPVNDIRANLHDKSLDLMAQILRRRHTLLSK